MPEKTDQVCENCRIQIYHRYQIIFVHSPQSLCVTCRDKSVAAHAMLQRCLAQDGNQAILSKQIGSSRPWEIQMGSGVVVSGQSPKYVFLQAARLLMARAANHAEAVALWARNNQDAPKEQAHFDRLQGAVSGIIEAIGVELEYA